MKNLPIYLALIWLTCRIVLGQTALVENEFSASLMINMLFLIIAIYFAIGKFRQVEAPFLEVAKAGMRSASVYAFAVGLAIFGYYQFVDASYIPEVIENGNIAMKENIDSKGGWELVKHEYSQEKDITEETFFEEHTEKMTSLFSSWFIASTSVFFMVIGGVIYSLVATFIQRRMLRLITPKTNE